MASADRLIRANVRRYARRAHSYERLHGEIFNAIEQSRLRSGLSDALGAVQPAGEAPHALDMGCGSGNLTAHLLDLGARVTAADVSPAFLRLVREQFGDRVSTHRLNGRDLSEFGDGSFDVVAAYSVLHHIPDYLVAVREACRVIRPGGVLMIDHEAAPASWTSPALAEFRDAVVAHERAQPRSLRRFVDPARYRELASHAHVQLRRRFGDPRYEPEGDIHVWPDDHIEWDDIERVVTGAGFEVLRADDYLIYRRGVPEELWARYRDRGAVDARLFVARRPG